MKLNPITTPTAGMHHNNAHRSTVAIILAVASISGTSPAQIPHLSRDPAPPIHAGDSGPGELFLPTESPTLVGYTFDYDSVNGEFVQGAKLFSVALNDDTGTPSTEVSFKSVFSSSSFEMKHSTHYGLAGGLGLIKFATSLANSSEAANSMLGTEFKFAVEANYPPFKVDTINIPTTAFTPAALVILGIQNPAQRYQAWKNANFGDYVAYGYDLAGGIDFGFTMSQADSFRSASATFDASVTYKGITGTFGIASALKEIMQSGSMGYNIASSGCFAPPLPQLTDVIDQTAQLHYANTLNDWVSGQSPSNPTPCKQRRGLWLLPIANMSIGIDPNLPVWADGVMDDAAAQAQAAVETLFAASKWNHSPSVSLFLRNYTRPAQPINFDAALDAARLDIALDLNALKAMVFYYLDGDHAANPASQTAVNVAAQDVKNSVIALQEILDELRDLAASLPPVTVTLHESFMPNGSCVMGWRLFTVEIDNVAAFTNGTYQAISSWGYRRQGAEASIVLRAHEMCDDHFNVPKYMGGEIQNPSFYETVYTSGPSKGLKKLTIPFTVVTLMSAPYFRAEVLDDFSRFVPSPWIDASLNNE